MWVDAAPCAKALAAAVSNSTVLAKLVGPAGSATAPTSIAAYAVALESNLTLPCAAATGGAGAGARANGWALAVAALLAAAAAGL
jgi:hypothetical protein